MIFIFLNHSSQFDHFKKDLWDLITSRRICGHALNAGYPRPVTPIMSPFSGLFFEIYLWILLSLSQPLRVIRIERTPSNRWHISDSPGFFHFPFQLLVSFSSIAFGCYVVYVFH